MLHQARAKTKLTLQKQKQIELSERIKKYIDTQDKEKTIKEITKKSVF